MGRLSRALTVAGLAITVIPVLSSPAGAATANSGDEAQFVTLINQLRSSKGLGSLAVNGQLTAQARAWSANMSSSGLKENPNLAGGAPPGWSSLGENVGEGTSVDQVEQAFVNSPSHYVNLVNPNFNQVGVGVVVSNGTLWVTQEFMNGPLSSVTASAPAPVRHSTAAPAPARPAARPASPPAASAPPAPPAPPPPPPPPARLITVLGQLESFDAGPLPSGAPASEGRVS